MEPAWWEVPEEVNAFARVLVASNVDRAPWNAMDVIRFYEMPWDWEAEHKLWVAAGRPDRGVTFNYEGNECVEVVA